MKREVKINFGQKGRSKLSESLKSEILFKANDVGFYEFLKSLAANEATKGYITFDYISLSDSIEEAALKKTGYVWEIESRKTRGCFEFYNFQLKK